jgi:hypothetical protein
MVSLYGEALSEEIVFAGINAIIGQLERKVKVPLEDIKNVSVTGAGTLE